MLVDVVILDQIIIIFIVLLSFLLTYLFLVWINCKRTFFFKAISKYRCVLFCFVFGIINFKQFLLCFQMLILFSLSLEFGIWMVLLFFTVWLKLSSKCCFSIRYQLWIMLLLRQWHYNITCDKWWFNNMISDPSNITLIKSEDQFNKSLSKAQGISPLAISFS